MKSKSGFIPNQKFHSGDRVRARYGFYRKCPPVDGNNIQEGTCGTVTRTFMQEDRFRFWIWMVSVEWDIGESCDVRDELLEVVEGCVLEERNDGVEALRRRLDSALDRSLKLEKELAEHHMAAELVAQQIASDRGTAKLREAEAVAAEREACIGVLSAMASNAESTVGQFYYATAIEVLRTIWKNK